MFTQINLPDSALKAASGGKNESAPANPRSGWSILLSLGIAAQLLTVSGCRPPAAPPPPAPEVAVVAIQPERLEITTELPGRTAAFLVAEIRPQVNGLIQKRLFTEGSTVRSGEALYRIDPAPYQAALDNAAASLARAEAGLLSIRSRAERYRDLLADNAVSRQDYDDAAAGEKQAEAEILFWRASVASARINLGYTNITAPISGRIGKSSATDGALVTAYQPLALATIQQMDPIYVDVPQSAAELLRLRSRLKDGRLNQDRSNRKPVKLILADGRLYVPEGVLQFTDVTVDPTTGSVILRAVFPNPDGILLPGMFVRAVIPEGVSERAILVPQQAVARNPKGEPVALVVDGEDKVEQRMLTLDRAVGDRWLVTSGLNPGDRVIIEGGQRVRPGAAVRAVPFTAGRPAGPGSGDPGPSSPGTK